MDSYIDQPTSVRSGEELDRARLLEYLRAHLVSPASELTIEQFPAGFSNLTYCLKHGEQEMVLRRAPFGNQVKSAHDMSREYHVLQKLSEVYPLAPQPYLYCEDESIIGAPFFVMARKKGIILRREMPAGLNFDADTLRKLTESLIDNLAKLHQLDWATAGLSDLGRPDGYAQRQVAGWTRRYHAAQTEELPAMEQLGAWLADNLPDESRAALIHNDYKFDNLVLDPRDVTRLTAVLDWEMSTVGDPLMDLGTTLAYWVEAEDPPSRQQAAFGPTNRPGSCTRQELVRRYEACTGRAVPHVLFYYGYGLFKLAVIVQQIFARYARGHTQDKRFAHLDNMVHALADHGLSAIKAGRL